MADFLKERKKLVRQMAVNEKMEKMNPSRNSYKKETRN
jgi:hypothetical protein